MITVAIMQTLLQSIAMEFEEVPYGRLVGGLTASSDAAALAHGRYLNFVVGARTSGELGEFWGTGI